MSRELLRIEVLSDAAGADPAGEVLAVFAPYEGGAESVSGEEHRIRGLPLDPTADGFSEVRVGRVLRLVYPAGSDEWRITEISEAREEDGTLRAHVDADALYYDLGRRAGYVTEEHVGGEVFLDTGWEQVPASEILADLIGRAGLPYVEAGTLAADPAVDLFVGAPEPDTHLSAIHQLAERAGLEPDFRTVGATVFVDLIDPEGAASGAELVVGRNLITYDRQESSVGQRGQRHATVVIARGADGATISGARWEVGSVAGDVITLLGGPLLFPGQMDGTWIEGPGGDRWEVTATDPEAETVTAPGHTLQAGDFATFRQTAAGKHLLALTDPAAMASYGRLVDVIDRPEIPPTVNLLEDAYLADGLSTLEVGGSPSLTAETSRIYRELGERAVRVTAVKGEFVAWPAAGVTPTERRPWFTAALRMTVESGTWALELVDVTNGVVYPTASMLSELGEEGGTTGGETGTFEWFALRLGRTNFHELGTEALQVRLALRSDAGEAVLDGGLLAQDPDPPRAFVADSGPAQLWREALDHLARHSEPTLTLGTLFLDLHRLDEDAYPHDEIRRGQRVRVRDFVGPGLDFTTRILRIEGDPAVPGGPYRGELSAERRDLVGFLGRPERRVRKVRRPSASDDARELRRVQVDSIVDAVTHVEVTYSVTPGLTSVWRRLLALGDPPPFRVGAVPPDSLVVTERLAKSVDLALPYEVWGEDAAGRKSARVEFRVPRQVVSQPHPLPEEDRDRGGPSGIPDEPTWGEPIRTRDGTTLMDPSTRRVGPMLAYPDDLPLVDVPPRTARLRQDGVARQEFRLHDGSFAQRVAAGLDAGTALHGESVEFGPRNGPPNVLFWPGGGIGTSGSVTPPYGPVFSPFDITASGCVADLVLRELVGGTTARSISQWSGGETFDLEAIKTLATEAWDKAYTWRFRVNIPAGLSMEVGGFVNRGSGWLQSWQEHYSAPDGAARVEDVEIARVVDGMGAESVFAVSKLIGAGFVDGQASGNAVRWEEATEPASVSATPTGASGVPWMAWS